MITKLNHNTFWYEPAHILMCWDLTRSMPAGRYYWDQSYLMLTRHSPYAGDVNHHPDPRLLFVNKMRGIWLNEYQPDLDQIFEEYEIVDNGWRGQIRVSEYDLAYWLLQCGS